MIRTGPATPEEAIFDLDFRAVMHWDPVLEKHYSQNGGVITATAGSGRPDVSGGTAAAGPAEPLTSLCRLRQVWDAILRPRKGSYWGCALSWVLLAGRLARVGWCYWPSPR